MSLSQACTCRENSEDVKDISKVLHAVFTSLLSDFGEFFRWLQKLGGRRMVVEATPRGERKAFSQGVV
ncbi:hypothetical protein NC653_007631 [Populus alba x Populus x berolinensis]|uniref:Phytochelatin synthase C-terminal domain-containing protein n=1 Tax=Populus alba x Populus x berolinensis TaxID=444605 RepID=A0AAD6RHD1_9ROSI|nr:hypothetical protein NC653_007631 [Populus alba x Populus x berolinensis]